MPSSSLAVADNYLMGSSTPVAIANKGHKLMTSRSIISEYYILESLVRGVKISQVLKSLGEGLEECAYKRE